jgi:D-alanine-D-alanine ligase
MRVAVLMGGDSPEREVSLASGCQVARALRSRGHAVVSVDTRLGVLTQEREEAILAEGVLEPQPLPPSVFPGGILDVVRTAELRDADVCFLTLHGGEGENGVLQTVLELAGIPFTGSGRIGCTLAMDKEVAKRLLRDAGIPTPEWLTSPVTPDEVEARFGYPVIVKPYSGGSTLGITLAHDRPELEEAIGRARALHAGVLFERYIRGREATVGVLGDRALPVGEIIPAHEIFDYACKYNPGLAEEVFPADLPEETVARLQARALEVHRALRMQGVSRVDFIVDGGGEAWCLEANALPGLTGNSLLPRGAAAGGISFPELCERIASLALERAAPRPEDRV